MKILVNAGSQCLSARTDGGSLPSPQIPENLQVPLRKLPNKVIFTCTSVSGTLQVLIGPTVKSRSVLHLRTNSESSETSNIPLFLILF